MIATGLVNERNLSGILKFPSSVTMYMKKQGVGKRKREKEKKRQKRREKEKERNRGREATGNQSSRWN